jgi:hypothetical protein
VVIERTRDGLYVGMLDVVAAPERHAPPLADLPPGLRGVSCCATCRDGLPAAQRCTREEDRRRLAEVSLDEIYEVPACPLDVADELRTRQRTGGRRGRWVFMPDEDEETARRLLPRLRRRMKR